MDDKECYEWAKIFVSPWDSRVEAMSQRAQVMGMQQAEHDSSLIWSKEGKEHCRWLFVQDPTNLNAIRDIYNSDEHTQSPCCFVVVQQSDSSDDRGEVIFDIFRLSPESYLWHFNRVYTAPRQ